MRIEVVDTWQHEWHILPSLTLLLGRCENEECNEIHAVQIHAQWLCFGVMVSFQR